MKLSTTQSIKVLLLLLLLGFSPIKCQSTPIPYLSDQLDEIIVPFSSSVIQVANNPYSPSDENCGVLTDYFTNCYLDLDSGSVLFHLKFRLDKSSSIDFRYLRFNNPTNFFYINQPSQTIDISLYYTKNPSKLLQPSVTLLYPSPNADICSETNISIVDSKVTGIQPLKINSWNLESLSPTDSSHTSEIKSILSQFTGLKSIKFPPLSLKENYQYKFSVSFQNYLGTQNKQYFEFATLSKDTPTITILSPLNLKNIDFRTDLPISVQFNGSICGNPSQQNPSTQISLQLSDGNQTLFSTSKLTSALKQTIDFIIPQTYLKSSSTYTILLKVTSLPQPYSLTINFSTMNAILNSSFNHPMNIIVDNSVGSTLLTANYTYFGSAQTDTSQFTFSWTCIDMSTLSNDCSSLFQSKQSNSLDKLSGGNRLYIITVKVQNKVFPDIPSSFSTIKVIKADISSSQYSQQPLSFSKPLSQSFFINYYSYKNDFLQSGTLFKVEQQKYNSDTYVVYMTNFKVSKVDFPKGSDFSISIEDALQQKVTQGLNQYILSIIIKNRSMSNLYLQTSLPYHYQYSLSVSSNTTKALIEHAQFTINCSDCPNKLDVYLYSDQSQFNIDISKSQFTYGQHFTIIPPYQDNSRGVLKFSLPLPNNPNKNNYNQIFIAVASEGFELLTTTVVMQDASTIVNGSTISSYADEFLHKYNFKTFGFTDNIPYTQYLTYLFFEMFNYFDQLGCYNNCSNHGSCQEVDELPFKQRKVMACVCEENYTFYDCSASYQNLSGFQNIFSQFKTEIQVTSIQSPFAYLKLLNKMPENYFDIDSFIPKYSTEKSESLLGTNEFISVYKTNVDSSAIIKSVANYLDGLIAYFNLFKQDFKYSILDSYTKRYASLFQTKFKQMGAPATYLNQTSYCGIVQKVPDAVAFINKIIQNNEFIVNSVCSTNQLSGLKAEIIEDKNEDRQFKQYYDAYLLFIENVSLTNYHNQTNPAVFSNFNIYYPIYFDVNQFYQQNGMLIKKPDDQKLTCVQYQFSPCQSSLINQNGKLLIKCECYSSQFIALAYDESKSGYNNMNSNQQTRIGEKILILCYNGIFTLVFIFLMANGYDLDEKRRRKDNENSKNSSIVQRKSQQNDIYFSEEKKLSCLSLHSIGKISITYSYHITRFARYVTVLYTYMSLPQFTGLLAKYETEEPFEVFEVGVLIVFFILLPLLLRLLVIVLNSIIIEISRRLTNYCYKQLVVNFIVLLYLFGLYGPIIYLEIELLTDDNTNYMQNWLIYLAIIFCIHAIVFEIAAMNISAMKIQKEQKKLKDQQKMEADQQLEKKPSSVAILEDKEQQINKGNQSLNISFQNPINQEQYQFPLEKEQNKELVKNLLSQQQSEHNLQPLSQEQKEEEGYSQQSIHQENQPTSLQEYIEQQEHNQQPLVLEKQEKEEEQILKFDEEEDEEKDIEADEEIQNQEVLEENDQQQIQLIQSRISFDPISIDGFDKNGNVIIPSQYDICKDLPKQEDLYLK